MLTNGTSTVIAAATTIALVVLFVAAVLCLVRLVRPGSVANRIVALDALLTVSVATIAVLAVRGSTATYIPTLVVAALIAFVGTITVARFIEHRGAQ
jgi:multicomponent Na+:H+ antiporter subunit F